MSNVEIQSFISGHYSTSVNHKPLITVYDTKNNDVIIMPRNTIYGIAHIENELHIQLYSGELIILTGHFDLDIINNNIQNGIDQTITGALLEYKKND